MFRNMSTRDDEPNAPSSRGSQSADTKNRIFGMSCDELEKIKDERKRNFHAKKIGAGDLKDPEEVASENADEPAAFEKPQSPQTNRGLQKMHHGIRYSSLWDEDLANKEKLRDQQLQQKKWLDQQIAERKSIDRKSKQCDDKFAKVGKTSKDPFSSTDNLAAKKREAQQEIKEYNEAMATQKRENSKKMKALEKKEETERLQKASEKDELMQQERAMSRDKRMNQN